MEDDTTQINDLTDKDLNEDTPNSTIHEELSTSSEDEEVYKEVVSDVVHEHEKLIETEDEQEDEQNHDRDWTILPDVSTDDDTLAVSNEQYEKDEAEDTDELDVNVLETVNKLDENELDNMDTFEDDVEEGYAKVLQQLDNESTEDIDSIDDEESISTHEADQDEEDTSTPETELESLLLMAEDDETDLETMQLEEIIDADNVAELDEVAVSVDEEQSESEIVDEDLIDVESELEALESLEATINNNEEEVDEVKDKISVDAEEHVNTEMLLTTDDEDIALNDSEHAEESDTFIDSNEPSEESVDDNIDDQQIDAVHHVVSQQMITHLLSQLQTYKKILPGDQYEALIKDHMRPNLRKQDQYAFTSFLVQYYISTKKYDKLIELLTQIEKDFTEFPIIQQEIEFLLAKYRKI
ncbi:hypothetical protein EJF36_14710 [Bacillus sp. HMF5848]|nr:hypothetical protein EJF36_14710 [Bacillus sp. HMF5848]